MICRANWFGDRVTRPRHATASRDRVTRPHHATASRDRVTRPRHATASRDRVVTALCSMLKVYATNSLIYNQLISSHSFDIVIVTEFWLRPHAANGLLFPANKYAVYGCDRQSGLVGGVSMFEVVASHRSS